MRSITRFGVGSALLGGGINLLLAIVRHPPKALYFVAWALVAVGVVVLLAESVRWLRRRRHAGSPIHGVVRSAVESGTKLRDEIQRRPGNGWRDDAGDWCLTTKRELRRLPNGHLIAHFFWCDAGLLQEPLETQMQWDRGDFVPVINRRLHRLDEIQRIGDTDGRRWKRCVLDPYIAHGKNMDAEFGRVLEIPDSPENPDRSNASAAAGERFRRWYEEVREFVDGEFAAFASMLTPRRPLLEGVGYDDPEGLQRELREKIAQLEQIRRSV